MGDCQGSCHCVRCIPEVALEDLEVTTFDGRHWDEAFAATRATES